MVGWVHFSFSFFSPFFRSCRCGIALSSCRICDHLAHVSWKCYTTRNHVLSCWMWTYNTYITLADYMFVCKIYLSIYLYFVISSSQVYLRLALQNRLFYSRWSLPVQVSISWIHAFFRYCCCSFRALYSIFECFVDKSNASRINVKKA